MARSNMFSRRGQGACLAVKLVVVLVLVATTMWAPTAAAQSGPPLGCFLWGARYGRLYTQLGEIMGVPTGCEQALTLRNPSRTVWVQFSTTGQAYWSPSQRATGFILANGTKTEFSPTTRFALAQGADASQDRVFAWEDLADNLTPPYGTLAVSRTSCAITPSRLPSDWALSCAALHTADLAPGLTSLLWFAINEINAYWTASPDISYVRPAVMPYSDGIATACGHAAGGGPFYCGLDSTMYLDVPFLASWDANFGDFATAVILAHESGHHIQKLFNISKAQLPRSPGQFFSIDIELQADCFSGAWALSEYNKGNLDPGDFAQALNAAYAAGDPPGTSAVDVRAHGTPDQRSTAFYQGYQSGDPSNGGMCWPTN